MKNIVWSIVVGVVLASCSSNKPDPALSNATVTIVDEGAKDAGLDLQALGELIKKSANPAKLEEALNTTGSINNLDLNKDGKVDYIKVSESGTGNIRELKFVDQLPDSSQTEVATVKIDKGTTPNAQASMDINGNQTMYGNNYSYHSGFSVGEVLLMAYLFSPHMPYYSPWGYRSYPGYYRPYAPVPMTTYRRTVTTYNSHPTGSLSTPVRTNTRSSLSSPTSSQRSFSSRDASKPVGSGGFGSRKSSSSSSSSSSPSSSRSGFGHSSSSSSRSSSSSSHSSSRSFGRSSGRRH